jgi:transcriptional regulator with PAS, ATPase and Fis domain
MCVFWTTYRLFARAGLAGLQRIFLPGSKKVLKLVRLPSIDMQILMQFFWLPSLIAEKSAPPRAWRRFAVAHALEDIPSEASAAVLEIGCEADSERAADLLAQAPSSVPVWIYDPAASVGSSVAWMKAGAAHVVNSADEMELAMNAGDPDECGPVSVTPDQTRNEASNMIGASRSMREVQAAIRMVADRNCSVLIEGETGTGKEVVAREIHATGGRSRGPWVAVNCSAIPESLLEAELFGYLKGAFTGAQQSRAGKFEAANHGTIFLDEIGDMPVGVQAKLLRVLQEREIERLGGNERVRLDIRVIAATNVDLAERVKDGRFRQDLFYRLNVFRIELPPLRERPDDIALLARHFVRKVCNNERIPIKVLDRSALERLRAQAWPGNVRELENTIETAVIVSRDRAVIFASDLRFIRSTVAIPERSRNLSLPPEGVDYQRLLDDFEVGLLTQALTRVRGNKTAAADLLGLKRTTLAAKMKALEARFPLIAA